MSASHGTTSEHRDDQAARLHGLAEIVVDLTRQLSATRRQLGRMNLLCSQSAAKTIQTQALKIRALNRELEFSRREIARLRQQRAA